jgi:hypothetical protein
LNKELEWQGYSKDERDNERNRLVLPKGRLSPSEGPSLGLWLFTGTRANGEDILHTGAKTLLGGEHCIRAGKKRIKIEGKGGL